MITKADFCREAKEWAIVLFLLATLEIGLAAFIFFVMPLFY